MAEIRPFTGIRPDKAKAQDIAALPYDVYNSAEAREVVKDHPLSFLRIDRAETQFPEGVDIYSDQVYQKAHDLLWGMVESGEFIQDESPCYYIYALTMNGRTQTGIAAVASIDDYENGIIKKHENTRAEKERDRIRHVDTCDAQTGPIFLAYRASADINEVIAQVQKAQDPEYDFVAEDGVRHAVWVISAKEQIEQIRQAFSAMDSIYIADGHHRAASAVKVGLKRRAENPSHTGKEEYNYFLSVLFPDEQLAIMDYNRVVRDLHGMEADAFLNKVSEIFDVAEMDREDPHPQQKGEIAMYLNEVWYRLMIRDKDRNPDPVEGLDVSLLQNLLLDPVLGIKDPKTDDRIDFVGGIRGMEELEKRCHEDGKVAFAMYPTSIGELFAVADANRLMPPKSTWFEPKLRSGIFIHSLSGERDDLQDE